MLLFRLISTDLCPAHDAANFSKCFYFQSFLLVYVQITILLLQTSKYASTSKPSHQLISLRKTVYFKLPKMLLILFIFIDLRPAHHNATSNFQKYFYFQCFSPPNSHLKNHVLQTSKNATTSNHFYLPMFCSPYWYFKRQKMILFESNFFNTFQSEPDAIQTFVIICSGNL